jgi:cell division septation protein DedD
VRANDSIEPVAVRNLEQIQEQEGAARPSRVSALVLASFGGACIVFAALVLMRSPAKEPTAPKDPLGDLVAAAEAKEGHDPARKLAVDDVTFPGVLTDQGNPTTAMEAIRRDRSVAGDAPQELPRADMPTAPPPATDRLPVFPLPAQDMLANGAGRRVAAGDTMGTMAHAVSRDAVGGEMAEAGRAGGYQLQVSSFKKREDADGFAEVLRRRGHRAHVEEAHVKGRGLWHRVRIGPFKYRRSAEIYRQDFEAKERMVGFVVDPPTTRIRISDATPEEPAEP